MSEPKKQEKDLTKEVDALLAETSPIAKAGRTTEAIDKLLALEKQTRNAADLASTTRLLTAITTIAYEAKDFALLNSNISLLAKKHGQLKDSIKQMVELAMSWLDDIRVNQGEPAWLELVETLRSVTEGKIFLETPRARLTLALAKFHERNSTDPSAAPKPKPGETAPTPFQSLETAAELLSELQVETYSSMERKEKTEFILEQMRLLVLLARAKDKEGKKLKAEGPKSAAAEGSKGGVAISDGESEWVKVRVGGRKVHEGFLTEKGNEDLKLKYYDLMIQFALHSSAYLDVAKYFYKIWETPIIKEEVDGRGREALENIAYYVVLAPHDNEQSDMINRLYIDPALAKLDLQYNLVKCFVTKELMRWPGIESIYGPTLRTTMVFGPSPTGDEDETAASAKRWEDLHTRVIEHNIRVISHYYTRITLQRLTSLLDLTPKETETILCRLVVSGTVYARIDRPAGMVSFKKKESAEDLLNKWAGDVGKLMELVEKSWMEMNAALAVKARS
ncbi:hypothetical protein FRC03_004055 [Tulasnella sp. 419]|nr:hypothetical protein FRC03_004055 [Tulasnella sp. 419]